MPNNQRDPNASGSGRAGGDISRAFAYTIIGAVVALAVMRHLFGSVRVEAGVK